MKIKKKVAILMAAYEGEKFLIDQISSILEQKNVRGIILIPSIIQNELNLNTIGRFSNNFFKFSYLF